MLLWPALLTMTAWAAAPTKAPGTFDSGAGRPVSRLALSKDQGVLTGVTESGELVLLDVAGWVMAVTGSAGTAKAPCTVSAALAVVKNASAPQNGYWVYLGCSDGSFRTWQWVDDVLEAAQTGAAGAEKAISLSTQGGEVYGIFPDPSKDTTLYALMKTVPSTTTGGTGTSNNPAGITLTTSSGVPSRSGTTAASFLQSGFKEAFPVGTGASVVVWHGGSQFSSWPLAGGAIVGTQNGGASGFEPYDVAPGATVGAYFVEAPGVNRGRLGIWNGNQGTGSTSLQVVDASFGGANAIVQTYRPSGTSWWVAQRGSDVDGSTPETSDDARIGVFAPVTTGPLKLDHAFDFDFTAANLIEGPAGYVIAATDTGELVVLTANPWIDQVQLAPEAAVSGSEITVTFEVDEAVAWTVRTNGTASGGGDKVATGTAAAAGTVTATFTVGSDVAEGALPVWVDATSKDNLGLSAHARTQLTIDNPPPAVEIFEVGFGNNAIIIDYYPATASDITGYNVYLSESAFNAAEFPLSGGPTGRVGTRKSPVFVAQPESTSGIASVTISGLKNGTKYWVAMRATDGTNEGGMSDVFAVTPKHTNMACDLKELDGEPCGGSGICGTTPRNLLGWGATLVVLGAVRRRRRAVGAVATVAGVALLGVTEARADEPAPAGAAIDQEELAVKEAEREAEREARLQRRRNRPATGIFAHDTTPVWADFEFRGGSFSVRDDAIEKVYGQAAPILFAEGGVQLFRYAEIDLGLGYLWKKGNTVADSGESSREEARIQWLPLTLGATLRAHVLDEQPFVPYASIGFTTIFWREQPLDANGQPVTRRRVNGSDLGWYWAAGGNLLLDLLNPRRASILEANSGINDTWLVIEYRQQIVNPGGQGGFDLSGWSVDVGVKLDY